jgi:two-component system cell cycle sensor histidine kinase/response regulator CckA
MVQDPNRRRRPTPRGHGAIPQPPPVPALLAAIVESADVAIVSKTLDGIVTSWNAAAERVYGYSAAEMVGTPIACLEPPARRGEIAGILELIARGERIDRYDTVRLAKNGTPVDVSLTVSPVRDDTGEIVGASVIGRDIRPDVEARAREKADSEARRRLIELIPTIVAGFDATGITRIWNLAATQSLGWAVEDMLDRPAPIAIARLLGDEPRREELELDRPDGTSVTVLGVTFPYREPGGSLRGHIFIGIDTSELHRVEGMLGKRDGEARASEARFRALFEQSAIATLILRDGFIAMANQAAAVLFGYDAPDELIGQPSLHRVAEADRPAVAEWRDSPLRHPAATMASIGLRVDGTQFPMRILSDSLLLPDGPTTLIYLTDMTEQRRIEAEREWLMSAVEQSADSVVVTDADRRIVYLNAAAERLSGFQRHEVLGLPADRLADSAAISGADQWAGRQGTDAWSGVISTRSRDGSPVDVDVTISPVRGPAGDIVGAVSIGRDHTHERALEAQLRQAQKMEAIGRLAGGIAHDFNNLLTVVSGNAELLLEELSSGDSKRTEVGEIHRAADRAASLIRQLLAFSRRQVLEPEVLQLARVVQDLDPLLRRVVGEDVELVIRTSHGSSFVQADQSQLEQVLMNLVVNARDAMPTGGLLTVVADEVELDAAYADLHLGVVPGPYVQLVVSDTGVGMDAATIARAFEPFFTTKGPGAGTGLGLSTVDGIVRQSGGHIWLYSEPGLGTTFKIFLPSIGAELADALPRLPHDEPRTRRAALILLVEDEPSVRALTRRFLEGAGHTVLEATRAAEAVEMIRGPAADIELLLTDVVMPGGDGASVAAALRDVRPDAAVLYMSGYLDETINHHGVLEAGAVVLNKPFSRDLLLRAVDNILGRQAQRQ